MDRIEIPIGCGFVLAAEQNPDPEFSREIYIGIDDANGVWHQDIAVVRNAYEYNEYGEVKWVDKTVEVMVYADEQSEDYTHKFVIKTFEGE